MNQEKLHDWSCSPGIAVIDEDMWTANSSTLNTFHPPHYRENYEKVSVNEGARVNTLQPFQNTVIGGISFPAYLGFDTNMSGTQDVAPTCSSAMMHISDTSYDNG
jgi:hypothetical protein